MTPTEGGHHDPYANPPIVEALVQFVFAEPPAWTVASPGLLYQEIRESYPILPEQQEQFQASFAMETGEGQTAPEFRFNKGGNRVVYKDASMTRLVLMNSESLSVNCLAPYEGWPSMFARLKTLEPALAKIGVVPKVDRVVIRYINRITIREDVVDLSEYVTVPVRGSAVEGAVIAGFLSRSDSVLPRGERVSITLASMEPAEAEEGGSTSNLLLDLELTMSTGSTDTFEEACAIADQLKTVENDEFESLITEKSRGLFK